MKDLEKNILAIMLGKQVDEAKKPLHPNQQKLDVHEPEKDELTAKDFEMLRAGKKAKMKEEVKVLPDDKEEADSEDDDEEVKGKKKKMDEARFKKGEDVGKPGMNFAKIAKSAAKRYGSEEAGKRVAGAVLKKVLAKEEVEYSDDEIETVLNNYEQLEEMDKSMAYATGTKKAMQMTGDKPPLEKTTIKKAHKIAKAMLRKEEVEVEETFADYDELIEAKPFEYEIQENYNFGDYLKTAKQLVGEEEAINLANEAYNAKSTDLFLEAVGRAEIESKIKAHSAAGHKVSMPKYSTKGGEFHAEYVVTDKESGIRRKYIHHGSSRKVENMGAAGKRD